MHGVAGVCLRAVQSFCFGSRTCVRYKERGERLGSGEGGLDWVLLCPLVVHVYIWIEWSWRIMRVFGSWFDRTGSKREELALETLVLQTISN